MGKDGSGHMIAYVEALVAAGNSVIPHPNGTGTFRPNQGEWYCPMAFRIDFAVVRAMPQHPDVVLAEDLDLITCRHCWSSIYGGAHPTLMSRARDRSIAQQPGTDDLRYRPATCLSRLELTQQPHQPGRLATPDNEDIDGTAKGTFDRMR